MSDEHGWTHREAMVNGIRLHYVEAGAGPLVVLLHGFPEFWYAWRHQIPALAAAGFRVIAPDLRGYNRSERPQEVGSYQMPALLGDVVGLIRHAGEERATVAGHDWGGIIAWNLAMHHPEVLEKLIVLNAPHPAAFAREIRNPRQLLRSWYAFFFQIPWLPEAAIRARNYMAIRRLLRHDPLRRGAYSEEEIDRYVEAIEQPGALTAMLNYYRANMRRSPQRVRRQARRIETPTLLIWGEQDSALTLNLTEGLDRWIADLRLERIPDSGHWVLAEVPERVNSLMVDFLRHS
ncbi:MAG TPA: alpha/beta hydrolase [Longimicrobiaceae bacterium]|nr:alpha/beta hydrolase [Longimicrobiaceae bacterium]